MDKDIREKKKKQHTNNKPNTVKKMRNQDEPAILSACTGERECLQLFFSSAQTLPL